MANLAAAFDILTRGADKAASDMDRVGNSSEKTGHKVEGASKNMRLLASTFTGASNQALGPLQEIADKFDVIERASESATTKAGGRLLGLGAAGVGAGAFLSTLASREQQGAQQLRAAIEASGHDYDQYAEEIEKAVKAGEHFGNQNATTLDALNRLAITTHNPEEALKGLSVAQDVAAAKHIDLQKAAELVGLTFNGSTRAGKQFGLQLENTAKSASALSAAQKASQSAAEHVVNAQQAYNDKLAVYNQTLKPTLAQQIALYRSHQAVTAAQKDAAAATDRLKEAQQKASEAADAGSRNVAKLATVVKGQGEASADSFAGHLRALGAQIEGTAGKIGTEYGGAITAVSTGTLAVGTIIESGLFPKLGSLIGKLGTTGTAFEALRDVEVATSAEGAAAIEANAVVAEAAMTTEGAAATALSAKFTGMFGVVSKLAGPVGIGLLIGELARLADPHLGPLSSGNYGGPHGPLLDPRKYYRGSDGKMHPKDGSDGYVDIPGGLALHPHAPQTPDDYDAKAGRGKAAVTASQAIAAGAKAAKATGDSSLQAFLDSIGGGQAANAQVAAAAAEAAKAAKQAAVDSATAIRDSIKSQFDAAKSILTDAVAQSKQLRESIASSITQGSQITDVFGTGPNLNGNHAFGSGQDFNSVKRFFQDRLTKLRRFAAELSALVHKGLDPTLVGQIAQAGLDQGGRLADALSGASTGQLGEITSLNKQVNQIADSAGKRVADVQFKAQIAADKKNTDALAKRLDEANRHLRVISREKPGAAAVDQRAQAFLIGS